MVTSLHPETPAMSYGHHKTLAPEEVRSLVDAVRVEIVPRLKFKAGRDAVCRVLFDMTFSQALDCSHSRTLASPCVDVERLRRLIIQHGPVMMAIAVIAKTKIDH